MRRYASARPRLWEQRMRQVALFTTGGGHDGLTGLGKPLQRLLCALPGCDLPVEPQKRGGDPKRYCSTGCQQEAYEKTHPRVPVAPPTGEPYQKARVWLLERLERGPVCTLELRSPPWRASLNPAQRVLELRNRQYDIRTVHEGGKYWYVLWRAGEPVGKVKE